MKHELRVMLPQGSGSIVNISSAYGSVDAAGPAVYVASKHSDYKTLELVDLPKPASTDEKVLLRITAAATHTSLLSSLMFGGLNLRYVLVAGSLFGDSLRVSDPVAIFD